MEVSFGRKQIPQTNSRFTRNFADPHLNTEPLDLKCALRISIVFCAHAGCWTGVAVPGIKVERFQRRPTMPQVPTREFERLPLRVHDFLAGVPLHDVWAIDLPRTRSGITLDEFSQTASARLFTLSPVVGALVNIRLFIGRLLDWDRDPPATAWESFAARLTAADRSKSLAAAGTREGLFRVVYRFYFAVYVRSVSRFTPFYMALIDPFRKLVVYPSLLRSVRTSWNRSFGTA